MGGIGGCAPCTPTTEVEAYDPASDSWAVATSLPVGRAEETVVGLGSLVYSIGGSTDWAAGGADDGTKDLLAFDPVAGTWTTLAQMSNARLFPTCDVLGGKIYCAGGWGGSTSASYPAPTEVYDPSTNKWSTLANLPAPRYLDWARSRSSPPPQRKSRGAVLPTISLAS